MSPRTGVDEAKIAEVVKELKSTGVYVDESLQSKLPADFQTQLRQQVAESKTPVFVALVPIEREDPNFHGSTELFAGVLHSDIGGPGIYLTYNADRTSIDGEEFSTGYNGYYSWFAAREQHPNDLQKQLTSAVTYINNGRGEEVYNQLREKRQETGTSQSSGSYGDDEGTPTGVVVGGTLALVLVLTVAAVKLTSRRKPRKPRTTYVRGKGYVTDRPFELPKATLSMIRQSQDAQLERRAEAAVLELGEAIDKTDLKPSGDAGAWQAALDHYDLSRRILDRKHTQADVVGALVLSERGRAALGAAARKRPWSPQRPCYFNPLHGAGSESVRWSGRLGGAQVPACAGCANDVRRDAEPDDVLDFMIDGRARHYFDLDLGVWSETGYGALDPDLVTRLFSRD